MKIKKLGLNDMTLLPPAKDVCQECAVKHDPEQPHNRDSLFYQCKFYQQYNRWPTWTDAMAHCSPEIQAYWSDALRAKGVELDK